jgi:hypothetical protein
MPVRAAYARSKAAAYTGHIGRVLISLLKGRALAVGRGKAEPLEKEDTHDTFGAGAGRAR